MSHEGNNVRLPMRAHVWCVCAWAMGLHPSYMCVIAYSWAVGGSKPWLFHAAESVLSAQ